MKKNTINNKPINAPSTTELIRQRIGHWMKSVKIWVHGICEKIKSFFVLLKAKHVMIASGAFILILVGIITLSFLISTTPDYIYAMNSESQQQLTGDEDLIDSPDAKERRHIELMDQLLADGSLISTVTVSMSDRSTLEYGVEDERVELLQIALIELGFLDIDETTSYYGPATEQAVSIFQRQHNIEQTGVADEHTLNVIFSAIAREYALSEGDEGSDVREIQLQLMDLAYMDKATGYYGEETVSAVKDFQERNGLTVTGVVDTQTRELLYLPEAVEGQNYAVKTRRRAKILTFIDVAEQQLGKRYSLGSTGPNYFDCSGLVYYCLREAGSNRRRLSAHGYSMVNDWEKITSMSDLEIGDLLFYYIDSRSRIGHVGIYIGGGNMIDASFSEGRIVKRSCRTDYWLSRFAFARRPW